MAPYDALVIGAGPAGSTAALTLARAGWTVALVEASAFPRGKVCGEFVSAAAWPLLDELGIGPRLRRLAGPPIRRIALFAGGEPITADPAPTDDASSWGRALGRETLDLLLLEAAARSGVKIWQPWRATSLERRGGVIECGVTRPRGSAALAARVVVDARGSPARCPPSPLPRSRRGSDLLAFKAHFEGGDLAPDTMPLLAFPGGYGGLVTSDADRQCLSCCIRRDALETCRRRHPGVRAGEAVLLHILDACPGARAALARAVPHGPWLATGAVRPGIRRAQARNGVFAVGNAAGEAHPVIAEGISIALQSGYLLARALLADGRSSPRAPAADASRARGGEPLRHVGRVYEGLWRERFALRVRRSAAVAHLAMSPQAGALLEPVLRRYPRLLDLGARLCGKARAAKSN